ncbi:MAG TPA: hypothetical protein VGK16_15070 [Candidatus Limnocylindrales bacterium]|jgi:hypothetical protein
MPEPVVSAPLTIIEPAVPAAPSPGGAIVPEPVREAARRLLAADGREFVLQPWQVAWLVATSEGREGVVPLGCGVGKGWLQARLDEVLEG